MTEKLFPIDYESWRYCIEVKCGLTLTPDYIKKRISTLGDPHNEESQRFMSFYGAPWRGQILKWFQRAASEA